MRRNNYTSVSDRRWQRRYERIQQRREEELELRDRRGRDADERIEDPFQQSELYAELLRRQEEEMLRRHLEEEQRRMREERERAMWADFERWLRHQYEDSPVYKVIFEDVPAEYATEPEPELSAGDSSALDGFLGNFLAPGA